VCRPCNKRYLKKQTPDNRPPNWQERLYLLLGYKLKPKISGYQPKSLGHLILTTKQTENTRLINWESQNWGDQIEVFTQSNNLTKRDAEQLVQELVTRSQKNLDPKPRFPWPQRTTEMIGLALRHGRESFWEAGLAFLNDQPWLPNVKGHDIERDSWRPFTDHFYFYDQKWQADRAATAERAKRLHRQQAEQVRNERLSDFLSVLKVPADWDGLTDLERKWLGEVRARQYDPGEVSADEAKQSVDLRSRYGIHLRSVQNEKEKVGAMKVRLVERLDSLPRDWVDSHLNEYEDLYWGMRRAETLDQLKSLAVELMVALKRSENPVEKGEFYPPEDW
jgi:hypothetical protein